MNLRQASHFKQRLIMSSVGVVFLALTIYFSSLPLFRPIFVLLNSSVLSLALWEYYQLGQIKGFQPLTTLGIICTVAYVFAVDLSFRFVALHTLPIFILLLFFVLFFLIFFKHRTNAFINLAITIFGIVYLTIPLTCGLQINYFFPSHASEDGRIWLAYALIVTKMTDVGAYFFGKTMGCFKLAPHISPKKTVEGAIGGWAVALGSSLFFYTFLQIFYPHIPFHLTFWQSIWLGSLISIIAQFGDLAESLLKREAGVKDSNHFPGLGGMLDMVDSLVFTLPLVYLVLKIKYMQ
jgi:phosphatidate cytidylyltransferase